MSSTEYIHIQLNAYIKKICLSLYLLSWVYQLFSNLSHCELLRSLVCDPGKDICFISLGQIPREEIFELYGKHMVNFYLKN